MTEDSMEVACQRFAGLLYAELGSEWRIMSLANVPHAQVDFCCVSPGGGYATVPVSMELLTDAESDLHGLVKHRIPWIERSVERTEAAERILGWLRQAGGAEVAGVAR